MANDSAVSVVGIGRMGLPIATHLDRAGFRVVVFDVDEERMLRAEATGLDTAPSASTAATRADILLTVLPGAAQSRELMLGAAALLEDLRAGACWLDLTSNDPRVAEEIAAIARERGIDAVGAPMAGGVDAAAAASLGFFVGGTKGARERVAPILGILSRPDGIRVVGDAVGSAFTAKLLINLLWFGQVAAVTEALLLGQRLGITPQTLRGLIAGSAGDSAFAQRHLDLLLDGDDMATFGVREVVDELDTLTALATETGTPFEVSGTVARLHRETLERFGAVDGELLVARLLEERGGTRLSS